MPYWWAPIRAKQLSMAATVRVMWLAHAWGIGQAVGWCMYAPCFKLVSENAPACDGCSEWGRYKGNCNFLLRWFRDGFLGLLTIYVPILYLPAFSESNTWDFHLVMTEISGNVPATSEDCRRITKDFRTLPKIKSAIVPEDVWALSTLLQRQSYARHFELNNSCKRCSLNDWK